MGVVVGGLFAYASGNEISPKEVGILLIRKIYILLFAPIALLIHMLSPLVLIRIGAVYSQRIGHLGLDLELSLCHDKSRKQNSRFPKNIAVFYLKGSISNAYLLGLWREKIIILPKWVLYPVHVINQQLPSYAKYNYFDWVEQTGHKDFSLFDRYPPTLSIPFRDLDRGEKLLQDLGIGKNQPYICLAVRDNAYLEQQDRKTDWSEHDYRDSDIANYLEMAEFLAGCGYVVLRMGQIVKTAFKSTNPNVIDYANSALQSDFADVFLFSTCSFCISTSTGMDALASIFRIPTGLVNVVNTDSVALGELVRIFQPKQFIDQLTGRALTNKEILHRKLSGIYRTSDFVRYGIKLIENTPEDLRLFAEELLGILALEGVVHGTGNEIRPTLMYGTVKKERMDKLSKSWLRNHQDYMK